MKKISYKTSNKFSRFCEGLGWGFILLLSTSLYSQNILTKEQALQYLLENNYSVKLAKNEIKIAKNNTSIYNSGYLPSVSLGAGANYSIMNQEIEAQNGKTANYDNSETQNYNASVGANYLLFNGFARKYVAEQLQEQLAMTNIEAEVVLEQAVLEVYSTYYQTAQIAENVKVLYEALQISKERLKRTQYQYEYGQTNKLALLNAQVDINNDSLRYSNTKQLLANSKRNLLLLIGDTQTQDYTIEEGVEFVVLPSLEVLLSDIKTKNASIRQLESALNIGEYAVKINKSRYLPTLGTNVSYVWNTGLFPETSLAARTMNYGLNAGLSLQWTLFDGATKTKVQNTKINLENQLLRKEQVTQQLQTRVANTYYSYQNKRLELQTQERNLSTAQTNFNRTTEMFKIGRVSSIEYRQAQLNLLHAQTAILQAKYEAKIVELQLLQLTGNLLNNSLMKM